MQSSVIDRILARSIRQVNGCLLWQGGADSKGYGMLAVNGKPKYIHRLVYEHTYGCLKAGEVVRHTCDTPRCCEPSHLLKGSKGDNIRDAFERGQLKTRRLPLEAVKALREDKLSCHEAAQCYGITAKYAYNVKRGFKRAD